MKWLLLIFLTSTLSAAPLLNDYEKPENTYLEFRNAYDTLQSKEFTQVTTTPSVTEMRDGEIFVFISTNPPARDVSLMLRVGTTIYSSPMFPIIKVR